MVANDSPIKSVADLKGKRLPSGYNAQTTGRVLQDAVLATEGLTMKDIRPVPTQSLFSGVDLLGEGKVDGATISIGTGQGQRANVSLSSRGGVRFINMKSTPEALAALRKFIPGRPFVVQPAPYAVGIVGPTTVMAYSAFFLTNAKMPDDLVYNLVKALHDNKAALVSGAPAFRDFDPKHMTEEIGVPWHPGAIKFYKEVGQWPPAT
jgi:TRAP transporter TAXI family solute receptor